MKTITLESIWDFSFKKESDGTSSVYGLSHKALDKINDAGPCIVELYIPKYDLYGRSVTVLKDNFAPHFAMILNHEPETVVKIISWETLRLSRTAHSATAQTSWRFLARGRMFALSR